MENNDEFNTLLKNIGKDVRQHRKKANLTQQQLAEKIKVSPSTIKRIEKGKIKNPSIEKLFLIASATKKNFYYSFSDADIKTVSKLNSIKDSSSKKLIKYLINFIYEKENPPINSDDKRLTLPRSEIKQMLTLIMDLI